MTNSRARQAAVLPLLILAALLLYLPAVSAGQRTAQVDTTCRSLIVPSISSFVQGNSLQSYFTTYDGTSAFPLSDLRGGFRYFSGEFRPRAGAGLTLESDYVSYYQGGVNQYGSVVLSTSAVDTDANGLPDLFQKNQSFNQDFSGSVLTDWPSSAAASLTGNLSRNAGAVAGRMVATVNSGSSLVSYTGTFYVLSIVGTATYDPAAGLILNLSLISTGVPGNEFTYTAQAPYQIDSPNQITIPAFELKRNDGVNIPVFSTVLTRSGTKYIGTIELADGNTATSWRDNIYWRLEINDLNDTDFDGVPDLSDPIGSAPSILAQPVGQKVVSGASVTLSVNAVGTPELKYQWLLNGAPLSGSTASNLVLQNFQQANAGSYTVRVTNLFGSVLSAPAALVLNAPPTVALTSPASGASFVHPASVTLTASAADPDGAVQKIDFFQNGVLLGSVVPPADSFVWNVPQAGLYTLVAKATDDSGVVTTSSSALIVVNNPQARLSLQLSRGFARVSWTNTLSAFSLESQSSKQPAWQPVTAAPSVSQGNYVLFFNLTNNWQFFRLKGP